MTSLIKKLSVLPILLFAILLLLPGFSFGQSLTDYCQNPDHWAESTCINYLADEGIKESQTSQEKTTQKSTINPTTGAKGGLGETPVSRGSQSNQKISIPNPLGVSTFADLIAKINRWLIMIGGPILTLMVLIGAFQIMTAGSTPDKVTEGRHTITWAVIGYGLLIISTGISYLIKDILGG